ncbi:MAG: HAD family hydrolase [Planctomycetota bacterium]|nr:MAG: HAD family hydrolase [Planctomycetota bacterium]
MICEPAVFLDKDGTLVNDVPYNVDPSQISLAPGAAALPRLVEAGYRLVVVSNQSGVARGYFDEQALNGVEQRLRELLEDLGAPLAGFYYCPHLPTGRVAQFAVRCECRKPQPGLLLRAAKELSLDLRRSWMIGDILDDVEAAHLAGCRAILLLNGGETQWVVAARRAPDAVARDLAGAATRILDESLLTGRRPAAVEVAADA